MPQRPVYIHIRMNASLHALFFFVVQVLRVFSGSNIELQMVHSTRAWDYSANSVTSFSIPAFLTGALSKITQE